MEHTLPHRSLCTDCGVSRLSNPKLCGTACQFIAPDYPTLETKVHGRARDAARPDELHFGPFQAMYRARMAAPSPGAQWTGITTALAADALESGHVDAVLTTKGAAEDRWKPEPVLITDPADLVQCRGMRMGYGPLLGLLEQARDAGHTRLAVVGIPCQIHALRAIEDELGFDEILVIGTPCSDNTTTEKFHTFLSHLSDAPETINYLEFRADYQVELRFDDGRTQEIPFLHLPLSNLPGDFFPITCRTCVDYTNALADITVGYMGGSGDQWLLVRNARGKAALDRLGTRITLAAPESKGKRAGAVRGYIMNTERTAGGMPLRRMPDWMRTVVASLQPRFGPRGFEFARARVEMKAAETVLHLRRHHRARMRHMIPDHVWDLVAPYGLAPNTGERDTPE
ncbi:MAG: Coenzyme F420 hydrogenase/dehydrogenase, beta subunit C-terminal domain [Pseudomonadota bacterium]